MTRLRNKDIASIASSLHAYEMGLGVTVGQTLKGLACHAVGAPEPVMAGIFNHHRAQVVPVDWGMGLIPGFTEAVAAILKHIGLFATITRSHNVAGFMEAVESRCDLVFISDDDNFTVFDLNHKISVHNAAATGRGFAAGLDLMAGGIDGRRALVVGCGPVGVSAAAELLRRGARLSVHDSDPLRRRRLVDDLQEAANGRIEIEPNLENALGRHDRIVDATPAAGLITAEMVGPETIVAAPGVPLGLTPAAVGKIGPRLLHDPLQIGVATMAAGVLAPSAAGGI